MRTNGLMLLLGCSALCIATAQMINDVAGHHQHHEPRREHGDHPTHDRHAPHHHRPSPVSMFSCFDDAKKFCTKELGALAQEGPELLMNCLFHNKDQLHEACRGALDPLPEFQCSPDAVRLCPEKKGEDLHMCMMQQHRQLSQACLASVRSMFPHHGHGHRDHRGHRGHHDNTGAESNTEQDGDWDGDEDEHRHHHPHAGFLILLAGVALTTLAVVVIIRRRSRRRRAAAAATDVEQPVVTPSAPPAFALNHSATQQPGSGVPMPPTSAQFTSFDYSRLSEQHS